MFEDKRMKVAFATRNRKQVNEGFEQATEIAIHEISAAGSRELNALPCRSVVKAASGPSGPGVQNGINRDKCSGGTRSGGCGGGKKKDEAIDEELLLEKVASLAGVSVLFVNRALNAYSALALNQARIFTVKVDNPEDIGHVVGRLREMLKTSPPLWLRRALIGSDAGSLVETRL